MKLSLVQGPLGQEAMMPHSTLQAEKSPERTWSPAFLVSFSTDSLAPQLEGFSSALLISHSNEDQHSTAA